MQSDWNSFGEDVVLDSINMAYRGEDSILYFRIFIMKMLNFESVEKNACLKVCSPLKRVCYSDVIKTFLKHVV